MTISPVLLALCGLLLSALGAITAGGVLVDTFSNGASVDWGPGDGLWFVGDNSNTGELAGNITFDVADLYAEIML